MTSPPPPAVDREKFDAALSTAGFTVSSLARSIGYSRTQLSAIVNGRRSWNSRVEAALRTHLGGPAVEQFLTR